MSQSGGQKQKKGAYGERIARDFLLQQGYEIIEQNFSKRNGETDIIAFHTKPYFGRTLCFIEVKYRSHYDGSAERSVGYKKIGNMSNSAKRYCIERGIDIDSTPIQFEQISVYGSGSEQKIFHYEIPN